ncbi:MAG TPA: efflux RND transporter permease subunit [Gemmataceae bacterium]|jgi:cobalt-zinc-cadmium resistance protein CzcA|nr:efflux RND transporter permease subunit [Gemmataceae bacterium]
MVRKLIDWAVNSPLIVLLLVAGLVAGGTYAFFHVNVEAYPDPAPAIIEVVAQYPGASAEEVERLVTIPLEVTLAGMPGLKYTRSKSLFGLSHLRNQFDYGVDYYAARQEVINRLQFTSQLPAGVTPQISPMTPTGELMRYTVEGPRQGRRDIYSLSDLKALEDWTLEREFRRVPRIADVSSFGGTIKRYEIRPDPARLKRYGITLQQLQTAITNSNANVGGDILTQGRVAMNVRGIGLIGGGLDPAQQVLGFKDPFAAADYLRGEEQRRLQEIREIVLATVNNVPVRVEDVVDGGPVSSPGLALDHPGVALGYQTRLGKVSLGRPMRNQRGEVVLDKDGNVVLQNKDDVVAGIVLMRKNEAMLPAVRGVKAKLEELNDNPGRLLPGVKLKPYYDAEGLIDVTTETVRENLAIGMALVVVILLMFLSNVRSALIVAVNVPLALLFAFGVLFLRGKSANLLSIGAVDFGIIVDSSVIMVENIYRHISAGEHSELPLKERIIRASGEVEKALFFSTAIMVCAFIPLFTMQGPEGQIFGPMADTYAFALAGALLLALTVAPALCLLFFKHLRPSPDNFLVRWLKHGYLRRLESCLNHPWLTLGVFTLLIGATLCLLPWLGGEFMPVLEEGNLYVRATLKVNVSLDEAADTARKARELICQFPEVQLVQSQVGRPDDGTDPTGYYNVEFTIPLKPEKTWTRGPLVPQKERPAQEPAASWRDWLPGSRKEELVKSMNDLLRQKLPGIDWNFSQYIRDNVTEALSGVKGDNSVKIIGPDLAKLESIAENVKRVLNTVKGIEDVGIFHIMGQPNLEFSVDRARCKRWGISVADVETAIKSAIGGQAFTQMTEGEKTFDVTLRWPERLRGSEETILNIPVDVTNNTVTSGFVPGVAQTPLTGAVSGASTIGNALAMPSWTGSLFNANFNNISNAPRRRLRDLVTRINEQSRPDPSGQFVRSGASTIYREQGKRLIAVKFSVRGRDLAGAVADAQDKTTHLFTPPYRAEWSGEFQEMQEANERLLYIIPLSLGLIFILLYLAFHSLVDVLVILSNVVALSLGGIWALWLTGTSFSISAAVGFISIFGVAIMDGLLLVSYFNQLRARQIPLREAIMQGAEKRVRPIMMTALTAIFGLLPAALSTRIGAQTQRPLAIVVVGGMITTLFLTRYLMPVLYSFYGHREPPAGAGGMAH